MKARCLNPKHERFADYGAKGITVCDRWMKFENFLADIACSLCPVAVANSETRNLLPLNGIHTVFNKTAGN